MRIRRQEQRAQSRRAGGVSPLLGRVAKTLALSSGNSRLTPAARPQALDSIRSAFTLTELLVVMVILAILTAMTVAAVNFSLAGERSRAAARQVQSYLEGARDRAIYESAAGGDDHPVGVRFLLDSTIQDSGGNAVAVSSMLFVENVDPPPTGSANIQLIDPNGTPSDGDEYWRATQTSGQPSWSQLARQGLLVVGGHIKFGATGEAFTYTIIDRIGGNLQDSNGDLYFDPNNERFSFQPDFNGTAGPQQFELILPPVVRPNQEPMLLPRGIVIDLDRSRLPGYWTSGSGYINQLDIMFSPRGTVVGRAAAGGLIHFYLAEAADVERLNTVGISGVPAAEPFGAGEEPIGDRVLVTLFPQTGAISSHPVNPTDADTNNVADDPYRYAELGEVAAE